MTTKRQVGLKLGKEQLAKLNSYCRAHKVSRTSVIERGIDGAIGAAPELVAALKQDMVAKPYFEYEPIAAPTPTAPEYEPGLEVDITVFKLDLCSDPDCSITIRHARH